ncbi:sin3 histone deacetylase corepressor complex component SDS3-like [Dysidea avara]|uniref:sin3 histone deacetylase corepressor complex component SDS3-like n=1 Tax=Dysidea avara TaxID=196820 RepID=UPI003333E22B
MLPTSPTIEIIYLYVAMSTEVDVIRKANLSEEDTEDASETDLAPKLEDGSSVVEKIKALKQQLVALEQGTHSQYLSELEQQATSKRHRIFIAECFKQYETLCAQSEYETECEAAQEEFKVKEAELKECLIADLLDKRRHAELEKNTMEVGGDVLEPKPVSTRKLRRRANDPIPVPEKRRKAVTLSSLMYLLDDQEIDEDLRTIYKARNPLTAKNVASPTVNSDGTSVFEARIEDGKLFYDKRWFHKNQMVFIESKEHGQESGVITSFGTNEVWIKRLPDNYKLKVYLSQLVKGKYTMKRRSA